MLRKQAFNPYLPSYEYIPDGEPHVFGDRIYIYGSHDRFNGADYCLNDYVCWSAPLEELGNWRYEGVIYRKSQDPFNKDKEIALSVTPSEWALSRRKECFKEGINALNPEGVHAMWAPDVVQGTDGRYYLYYSLDIFPEVAVAVCDSPAGSYSFLGFVHYEDGTHLGRREGDFRPFDPAVLIDEDGTVYLYAGHAPAQKVEGGIGTRKGAHVTVLADDMLTIRKTPVRIAPTVYDSEGTGYEGHEFFEASSMRKINNRYYFIYSSVRFRELCYAVSNRPDRDFIYGGKLVDIADVGIEGRTQKNAINAMGNTHGSLAKVGDNWYIFYHRHTNRTDYSRQGCAEKIVLKDDGSFEQTEVTSCGLNEEPLRGHGIYPARICCHLTGEKGMVFSGLAPMGNDYPYFRQDEADMEPDSERALLDAEVPVQYITNLQDGSMAGYKYFEFIGCDSIGMELRGCAEGKIIISVLPGESAVGEIPVSLSGEGWQWSEGEVIVPDGVHALYFIYVGTGKLDFRRFELKQIVCY